MIHPCDGRAMAYSALSIYAICCRALKSNYKNMAKSVSYFIDSLVTYYWLNAILSRGHHDSVASHNDEFLSS